MPTEEESVDGLSDLVNDCPDTLRVMISTDNHLGFAERDNVRGMDSFSAFEEVLYLSKRFNCDMVLVSHLGTLNCSPLHCTIIIAHHSPFFVAGR